MNSRLLLTVEVAAEKLSIGRSRFYQLLKAGKIETVLIGKSRRVPIDALESYVKRLRDDKSLDPLRSEDVSISDENKQT